MQAQHHLHPAVCWAMTCSLPTAYAKAGSTAVSSDSLHAVTVTPAGEVGAEAVPQAEPSKTQRKKDKRARAAGEPALQAPSKAGSTLRCPACRAEIVCLSKLAPCPSCCTSVIQDHPADDDLCVQSLPENHPAPPRLALQRPLTSRMQAIQARRMARQGRCTGRARLLAKPCLQVLFTPLPAEQTTSVWQAEHAAHQPCIRCSAITEEPVYTANVPHGGMLSISCLNSKPLLPACRGWRHSHSLHGASWWPLSRTS